MPPTLFPQYRRPVYDATLEDFGAKHDGVANDRPALSAACAWLNARSGGGHLYVPSGTYRITDYDLTLTAVPYAPALYLSNPSGCKVSFAPGAILSMENNQGMVGLTGIGVNGPTGDVTVEGARVRWPTAPTAYGAGGSGIECFGYPGTGNLPLDVWNFTFFTSFPTSGTFDLHVTIAGTTYNALGIAYNATAAAIQTALNAALGVAATATVTSMAGGAYTSAMNPWPNTQGSFAGSSNFVISFTAAATAFTITNNTNGVFPAIQQWYTFGAAAPSIQRLTLKDIIIENAGNKGIALYNVDRATIKHATLQPYGAGVRSTGADGIQINACQRVDIRDVNGIATGDDLVSVAAFYDPSGLPILNGGPWRVAGYGAWNSQGVSVSGVRSYGQVAAGRGVAVWGAQGVQVSDVHVNGNHVFSAVGASAAFGAAWQWYLAPVDVVFDNVTADDCYQLLDVTVGGGITNAYPSNLWSGDVTFRGVSGRNFYGSTARVKVNNWAGFRAEGQITETTAGVAAPAFTNVQAPFDISRLGWTANAPAAAMAVTAAASTRPANPTIGQIAIEYNVTPPVPYYYNGAAWKTITVT